MPARCMPIHIMQKSYIWLKWYIMSLQNWILAENLNTFGTSSYNNFIYSLIDKRTCHYCCNEHINAIHVKRMRSHIEVDKNQSRPIVMTQIFDIALLWYIFVNKMNFLVFARKCSVFIRKCTAYNLMVKDQNELFVYTKEIKNIHIV